MYIQHPVNICVIIDESHVETDAVMILGFKTLIHCPLFECTSVEYKSEHAVTAAGITIHCVHSSIFLYVFEGLFVPFVCKIHKQQHQSNSNIPKLLLLMLWAQIWCCVSCLFIWVHISDFCMLNKMDIDYLLEIILSYRHGEYSFSLIFLFWVVYLCVWFCHRGHFRFCLSIPEIMSPTTAEA